MNDCSRKVVLVTGGTKGIGLATALAFGSEGAHCVITHKWGSADEIEIGQQFEALGAPKPLIVQADAREADDTDALLAEIKRHHGGIDVFVSAAAFGLPVDDFQQYTRRAFVQSMEYTTWPIVEYTKRIHDHLGRYPRYVIGLSSGGPDEFYTNYDIVASCKAALETLCRYMAHRLSKVPVNVNVVRARFVRTQALRDTGGVDFEPFVEARNADLFTEADEVASAIVGLCSGLMDAINGQVIMVDKGTEFFDGLSMLYDKLDPSG